MTIVEELAAQGWCVREEWLDAELVNALWDDLRDQVAAGALRPAAVGRAHGSRHDAEVRTDSTTWLDGERAAPARFLARMEALRAELNSALYLGLFDYEAHYAIYRAGGFYRRHVDALRGARNRVVSTVTFLTPGWTEVDGGELVLHAPDPPQREVTRVLPRAGTLVLFLSEELPHEVLPPGRDRASIAGWFRCNPSSSGRVDPAR